MELQRRGTEWMILSLDRPAGEEELYPLKAQLERLQPVDLLAEKGPYGRFGLNPDKQTVLELESRNGRERFFVGGSISLGNYSYIRRENDPAVYALRGNLTTLLAKEDREYRSRQIFNFPDEKTEALIFKQGEMVNILEELETARQRTYLKRLSQLKCLAFEGERTGREDVHLTITVITEKGGHTLYLLNRDRDSYTAGTEDQPDLFLLSRYDGDSLMELSGFGEFPGL